jgi:hypothetical protein
MSIITTNDSTARGSVIVMVFFVNLRRDILRSILSRPGMLRSWHHVPQYRSMHRTV